MLRNVLRMKFREFPPEEKFVKKMFDGNGKEVAYKDEGLQRTEASAEIIQRKWVISIIDAQPNSNAFLKEYLRISRCLRLGDWYRADLDMVCGIARSTADAVLVDARLPGDQAVQSVYLLKKVRPSLVVIILDDQPNLACFIRFAQACADGFFQIPGTRHLFEQTVLEAINGAKPLPQEIRRRIFDHLARHFAPANGKRLTQAEAEILVGLLDGKRDKEIASDRRTREGTIHAITNSLYKKLSAHSRAEVVQRFLPLGETFGIVRRLAPTKR
jgi:DNA-binding NarL/FixJ family response regulator